MTVRFCDRFINLNIACKSSRLPPIIAYVIGNPKDPALNDDSGVPPVAMEIGNLPCSTRG